MQTVPAAPGDVFLLCSDGLTTMLDDEQIAKLLAGATSIEAAVRALVDEANRAGGRDNITALAFRLEDAAAPRDDPRRRDPDRPHRRGGRPDRRPRSAAVPPRPPPTSAASSSTPSGRASGSRPWPRSWSPWSWSRAIAFGAWYGNRQVWFLGTDDGGRVALYRGLPYELPFGIALYDERYATPIQTAALPSQARATR